MTQFDVAAAALLVVFGYGGYRRGLIVFVVQAAGSVLAFALAAVLAPALVPYLAPHVDVPEAVLRPVAVAGLTLVLRVLFGFAVRELTAALRGLLGAVPPLALVDRLLGIVPGLALGALVVLTVTLALLTVRTTPSIQTAVAGSWLARNVVTRPDEALAVLRGLWGALVVTPPRLETLPVAAGVGGLWLGALAAWRWRSGADRRRLEEAPTRPMRRPAGPMAEAEVADPLAWPRAALGVLTAGGLMALLVLLSRVRQ